MIEARETRLNDIAVAIGAPMNPRRIGLGPHTVMRIRQVNKITRRDKDMALPRNQLRTALMGATADMTRVGAANSPADKAHE